MKKWSMTRKLNTTLLGVVAICTVAFFVVEIVKK